MADPTPVRADASPGIVPSWPASRRPALERVASAAPVTVPAPAATPQGGLPVSQATGEAGGFEETVLSGPSTATLVERQASLAGPEPKTEPGAPTARPVAQQIAAAITGAAEGRVEIRLDPEELGRVALQLQTDGDRVSLVITAERAETSELLRRHLHELAQEFRAMGYRSVDLGFGGQGGAHGRGSGAPGVRPDTGTEPPPQGPDVETSTGPFPGPSPVGAGLDLRM